MGSGSRGRGEVVRVKLGRGRLASAVTRGETVLGGKRGRAPAVLNRGGLRVGRSAPLVCLGGVVQGDLGGRG